MKLDFFAFIIWHNCIRLIPAREFYQFFTSFYFCESLFLNKKESLKSDEALCDMQFSEEKSRFPLRFKHQLVIYFFNSKNT